MHEVFMFLLRDGVGSTVPVLFSVFTVNLQLYALLREVDHKIQSQSSHNGLSVRTMVISKPKSSYEIMNHKSLFLAVSRQCFHMCTK